jgi:hypothetical protein
LRYKIRTNFLILGITFLVKDNGEGDRIVWLNLKMLSAHEFGSVDGIIL